jgi:hypothetical protein
MTRADMNETRIAPELWLANSLGITPRLSTIERNEFIKEVKGAFFSEIERLLKEAGQLRPPIDPTQLFGSRKIDKMTSSDDVFEHGKLLVSPSGFSIVVSTRISGTHARFVIAHEICHTFFYDLSKTPPVLGFEKTSENQEVLEGLCSEGARHILMPDKEFREWCSKISFPNGKAILGGMNKFLVSAELLIRRLREFHQRKWSVGFIFISYKLHHGVREFTVDKVYKVNLRPKDKFSRKSSPITSAETIGLLNEAIDSRLITKDWGDKAVRIGSYEHTGFPVSFLRLSELREQIVLILPRHNIRYSETKLMTN